MGQCTMFVCMGKIEHFLCFYDTLRRATICALIHPIKEIELKSMKKYNLDVPLFHYPHIFLYRGKSCFKPVQVFPKWDLCGFWPGGILRCTEHLLKISALFKFFLGNTLIRLHYYLTLESRNNEAISYPWKFV